MAQALVAADLGNTSLGRQIAVQNYQAASFLQRFVQRYDHFLAGCLDRILTFSKHRQTGHGNRRLVDMPRL